MRFPSSDRVLVARVALVVYLGVAGLLLFSPGSPGPDAGHLDKLGHAVAGFGLGLLVWASMRLPSLRVRAAWVLGAGMLFAAVTEVGQAYVPGRNADVLDAIADFVGTLVSIASCVTAARCRPKPVG